ALTTMLTRVKYPTLASICLTESHTALLLFGVTGKFSQHQGCCHCSLFY
ncbi:hypothetical protein G3P87_004414, partial [Shigella sonnei]|nr:hypothetical protein [Shigella sonnei]